MDGGKLTEIIGHLLDNAIKFTDEGFVEVGIGSDKHYLRIHVADTGIGIAAENHQRIFDRFWQVDHSNTRIYGGNGIGLTICKSYADLMTGTITLNSEINSGSKFLLTIPH